MTSPSPTLWQGYTRIFQTASLEKRIPSLVQGRNEAAWCAQVNSLCSWRDTKTRISFSFCSKETRVSFLKVTYHHIISQLTTTFRIHISTCQTGGTMFLMSPHFIQFTLNDGRANRAYFCFFITKCKIKYDCIIEYST